MSFVRSSLYFSKLANTSGTSSLSTSLTLTVKLKIVPDNIFCEKGVV